MTTTWRHYDPSLPERAEYGAARAEDASWGTTTSNEEARDLQAFGIWSCYDIARLIGTVTTTEGDVYDTLAMTIDLTSGSGERYDAALRLATTWNLLDPGVTLPDVIDSQAITGETETSAIQAGVAITAIVVTGFVVGYLAYNATTVIDRQLARNAAAKAMLQKHAAVERLVDAHLEREAEAGGTLPLDDATKTALDQLGQLQAQVAPSSPENFPAPSAGGEWSTLAWGAVAVGVLFVAGPTLAKMFRK